MAEYQDFISSLTGEEIEARLLAVPNKVDKEGGKGLSSNDFTDTEKAKLEGVETGAQKNPGNATTSTPGLMSATDKEKLDGVAVGANKTVIDATLTQEGQAADAAVTGAALAQQKSIIDDLTALVDRKAGALIDTASGAIASFVPDATIDNLLGVTVDVEPVQDLHGYDNPWPAGGGKNKLDTSSFAGASYGGVTYARQDDGGIKVSGTISTAASIYIVDGMNLTLPAGTYTLSGTGLSQIYAYLLPGYRGGTFTLEEDTTFTGFQIRQETVGYAADFTYYPQLELGSTATDYAPYSNECPISGWNAVDIWNKPTHDTTADPTVTIQLGQTVYGGTLDVTNGVLTVDRISQTVDQNSGVNRVDDNRCWIAINEASYTNTDPNNADGHIISDRFRNVSNNETATTPGTPGVLIRANGSHQAVISMRGTAANLRTAEDWNVWLSSNPVQLVYELATPIEIPLTPTQIATISGQTNNIWSDAGDVTVEYAADLKTYIDSKIAAAVAALS